jgi:hypothetical protein
MRRDGEIIGSMVVVTRAQVGRFADKEVDLLQTFADQAVIAIENVRLFNETKEALASQTASAEILRVMSRSLTDVKPVFEAIVANAVKLLVCDSAFVMRRDGNTFSAVAAATPEGPLDGLPSGLPIDPRLNFPVAGDRGEADAAPARLVGNRPARLRARDQRASSAYRRRCTCRCCATASASAC